MIINKIRDSIKEDILWHIENHSSEETDAILVLAGEEIRSLRMALSRATPQSPHADEIILAALNGAATTVATRHDCPPEKMVKAAIAIKNELEKLK